MAKYLQIVESHYSLEMDLDKTWALSQISLIFEYFACVAFKEIESDVLRKLMISLEYEDATAEKYTIKSIEPSICAIIARVVPKDLFVSGLSSAEQFKRAFYLFKGVMDFAAEHFAFDKDALARVYAKIESRNFIFQEVFLSKKNKKCQVELSFELERNISFYAEVKGEKSFKVTLFSGRVTRIEWKYYFGKIKINGDDIIIEQAKTKNYWQLNLATGEVYYYFYRAETGDAHGQYDLAKMYEEGHMVPKSIEKAKYWLEKAALQGYSRAVKALNRINEGNFYG